MVVDVNNLKWYYTTGNASGAGASNANGSIGGTKSDTVVPNDTLNNLFPQVTGEQARTGITQTEYIGVMFINEDSDTFGTPKFYSDDIDSSNSSVKLEWAVDNANPSTTLEMSRITNRNTEPTAIRSAFASIPSSSGGAVQLPGLTGNNMATNIRVGIWFSRKIDAGATADDPFAYTLKIVGEANI